MEPIDSVPASCLLEHSAGGKVWRMDRSFLSGDSWWREPLAKHMLFMEGSPGKPHVEYQGVLSRPPGTENSPEDRRKALAGFSPPFGGIKC